MPRVLLQNDQWKRIIRHRRLTGADRFDEVWNGLYVTSPIANNEHQTIATYLAVAFVEALGRQEGLIVQAAANVSDQEADWTKNYRCPDVLVFLPGNTAEDRKTHWYGGPDFAVEILSQSDRSRKKFGFYARVGVRELLLVDRRPWRLELYRLNEGAYQLAGKSEIENPETLAASVLPLTFGLLPADPRPLLKVTRPADGRTWSV